MKHLTCFLLCLSFSISAMAECFERTYDKDHLKKFPKQEIRNIIMNANSVNIPDSDTQNAFIRLSIKLIQKNQVKMANLEGVCKNVPYYFFYFDENDTEENSPITCTEKGGSGTFTITKSKPGMPAVAVKLQSSLKLNGSNNNEKISLIPGDNEFKLNFDKNIDYNQCEPVLFLPHNVSIGRLWNESLLQAVRYDLARPTVTARNLFHLSIIMWDIYASFDKNLKTYFLEQKPTLPKTIDITAARNQAISYAAYSFIKERYKLAPGNVKDVHPQNEAEFGDGKPDLLINRFMDRVMGLLGYDLEKPTLINNFDAAAFGRDVTKKFIAAHLNDGSREALNYAPEENYVLVNNYGHLDVMQSGVHNPPTTLEIKNDKGEVVEYKTILGDEFADKYDIDYWLPMYVPGSLDQNGNELDSPQAPLTLFWGKLPTFSDLTNYKSSNKVGVYFDEIAKLPSFKENPDEFIKLNLAVMEASRYLSPIDLVSLKKDFDGDGNFDINPGAEKMDISPAATGNNTLGTNDGHGYGSNPTTGKKYAPQLVKKGDFYRSLAEFWADGPTSETPPGHWNVITNYVVDQMNLYQVPYKWNGAGQPLPREQFELMTYFAVNGALYDAGIVAWGLKGAYQGSRPIGVLRKLAKMAETDPAFAQHLTSLSPHLKMVTFKYKETATDGSQKETLVTKLAIHAWRGPNFFGEIPNYRNYSFQDRDPLAVEENDFYYGQTSAGVGWILAENWMPYQRQTFVTPPFPGFISGHSTFSRAAAEVLAGVTGNEYFPGGLGTYPAPKLLFEENETHFDFQWAKYSDASDQSGISRIYGGIHASFDDIPGRIIGEKIGKSAVKKANEFFKK
ncbi:MAG: vanadium-dependent haloperoxidase [Bdellovibrionaceae bacterium]|nr:vanadium-dependent haloperoxidase [Pseudobdellovibrionaceae bacterium]